MFLNLDKMVQLNSLEKKYKKLKRDPDLFFKDMLLNHKYKVQKNLNRVVVKKQSSKNKFTVVSAVYNVDKYLEEYFKSIVNQSINFKESIYIVCVDDGSTDNSAKIIKKWQKKYPKNIIYIYKENGGQASARNLGLDYVETDWVSFIDPDDFISTGYFFKSDEIISKNNVDFISFPMAGYKEKGKVYLYNKQPLDFCYSKKDQFFDADEIGDKIQLSACNVILKSKIIKNNKLKFDEFIKPNFEDGKFIIDYFDKIKKICYSHGEYYYYRSREDSSSTSDTQWERKVFRCI